jgi:hypothetical protein
MSSIASRRIWRKLCRAVESECAPSGLHMGSPSLQLLNAGQFLVHPLHRSREDLLSLERLFRSAWETRTTRLGLAPDFALLLSCQSPLLVAHLSQAYAQCL